MYKGQALFSDVFEFALGHGFNFFGFTYLQEISSNRLPLGARAKGVLAFGDALFLRKIESVRSIASSPNELYLKLHKLAFMAVNFGYIEYALQALEAADNAKPDAMFRARLMARDCYRLLYALREAVGDLPPRLLHFDRSKLSAERKAIMDRVKRESVRQVENAANNQGPRRECAEDARDRTSGAQIETIEDQRIRHLVLRNPPAAARKLLKHLLSAMRTTHGAGRKRVADRVDNATASAAVLAAPDSLTGRPQDAAAVERVLEAYGYSWWADMVRQRREAAEPHVPVATAIDEVRVGLNAQ
jgi:hypothetical protein